MKSKNKTLHFKKSAIIELNDTTLHGVNGGTSAVVTSSANSIVIDTDALTNTTLSRGTGKFCDGVSIHIPTKTGTV